MAISLFSVMAISLQIQFLLLALSTLSVSQALDPILTPFFTASTTTPPPPQMISPSYTASPPAPPPPTHNLILNDHSIFSFTPLLAPILSHLGFNELATALPSLSADSSGTMAWSGPFTMFAPSDSSVRSCASCPVPSLLREHVVPGLFTIDYLRKLAFGTKIETISPGRCITVTSTVNSRRNNTIPKVFIGGVEITHPDLFSNDLVIVHGIQGYISPLSPLSCDIERMTSLSFSVSYQRNPHIQRQPLSPQQQTALVRIMLRDAILRLRNNGFSVVSLAMKVKYPELVTLNNMTVFALDDMAIFSGSHSYIHSVRFHIVPNQLLTMAELGRLPVGTLLPSLERGQNLVVTTAGGDATAPPMRINYVRIKVPDVMKNEKIVVHSLFLPFPHIHHVPAAYDGMMAGMKEAGHHVMPVEGACAAVDENGECRNIGDETDGL
ncbi:hypothetical protein SLE2022_366240 [Rubroshorea leprosula]